MLPVYVVLLDSPESLLSGVREEDVVKVDMVDAVGLSSSVWSGRTSRRINAQWLATSVRQRLTLLL